ATGTLPAISGTAVMAEPVLFRPAFSIGAMIELVIPLAIMVLVVQNGQGAAVLKVAGHDTPINACSAACGVFSLAAGLVGTVSTCLTGPTNAIITSSGARESHFAAAVMVGAIALGVGIFSPIVTRVLIGAPPGFLATLAGLAMLRVLQTAFVAAFSGRFQLGGLVTFLVTVAGIPVLNIGAAFWGLLLGLVTSWLLERSDFTG
ncbi:MAG TPA: benzoate/H(+) symporter BenE family transporter, partial [Hyphomicrobiaceae bacterium]|nr:benzoate/H(+) symporter BenE family transporter [Hyphomicrobiaceae bacterium]